MQLDYLSYLVFTACLSTANGTVVPHLPTGNPSTANGASAPRSPAGEPEGPGDYITHGQACARSSPGAPA